MVNAEDLRNTRVTYDGSQAEGAKWLPFAYKMLSRQYSLFKTNGLITSKAYQPQDGILIRCAVGVNGLKSIYIKSVIAGCPLYKNGIIRQSFISEGRLNEFLISPIASDREFRPESSLAVPPNPYYNFGDVGNSSQHAYIKSGMFTGEMRKYMQLLLAYKTDTNFDYRWLKSHGLYYTVKYDLDTNGIPKFRKLDDFWIVQVSKEGLFMMKVDMCQQAYSAKYPLDSFPFVPKTSKFPTGDDLNAAIASGVVKQIYSSTEMEFFYKDSYSFFPEAGWVFAYKNTTPVYAGFNGSFSAINICYRLVGGIWTSQLWSINLDFVTDFFGNIIIIPSKTLSVSGRMYSYDENSGINVPDYTNGTMKTLDFSSFSRPPNGIFRYPFYIVAGESYGQIFYAESPKYQYSNPASAESANGQAGDYVIPAYRIAGCIRNPYGVNNGETLISEFVDNSLATVVATRIIQVAKAYYIPFFDRCSIIQQETSYENWTYYNRSTGVVSVAPNPAYRNPDLMINPFTWQETYTSRSLMFKQDTVLFSQPYRENILANALAPEHVYMKHGNEKPLNISLIVDSFTPPYIDTNSNYKGLYRINVADKVYSYMPNYAESSVITPVLTTSGLLRGFSNEPLTSDDTLYRLSFVGKP